MFDQLKQIKQLKDLQDKLEKEIIEVEKNGVKVVVNGRMEIQDLKLNLNLSKEEQESLVKDCFNEALRKIQSSAVQKMLQKTD